MSAELSNGSTAGRALRDLVKGGTSRAIVVVGMHRSGTSAVTRALQAFGVYLGDDFLDAQPENPTGYWEDRRIMRLNERVLKTLCLRWDSTRAVDRREFGGWRMWRLRRNAIQDLHRRFTRKRLWGFKDPRTLRLLPFWRRVLHDAKVDDDYLLVIRNPMSIAASLYARQRMDVEAVQRLWLVHMVPFLSDVRDRQLAVLDYDLLLREPRAQLDRMARRLNLSIHDPAEVDQFASDFLDKELRHTIFSPTDVEARTVAGCLTRDAFLMLYELATDVRSPDGAFWRAWDGIRSRFERRAA